MIPTRRIGKCRFILHCAVWDCSFFEKKEPKKLLDSCATPYAPQSSCIVFVRGAGIGPMKY